MNSYQHLLSELKIGSISIRNRVLVSAHVPGFAEQNKAGERYVNYHRQYAHGGVGLQITGGTPVHLSGLLSTNSDSLWNLDDSVIPGYQSLSSAVHEEGGRILAQLAHSAGTVAIHQAGYQSWSASATRSKTTGTVAHAMSLSEINEVIDSYVNAASRVKEGGLDGVEILSAFGFLPQAFLSPLTNWRKDKYGGSLENRMRFLVELLHAVRKVLGSEKILGVRLPGDEFERGGLDQGQMKEICAEISNLGLVDYFNIIAHTNLTIGGRSRHWAPTPAPHGLFVHLAAGIREVVNVPVFAVGRIVDPLHAESIVASGKADMVGMTRANICDPNLVIKIQENRVSEIQPCVGANTCIANRYVGNPIRCMHNARVRTPGILATKAANRRQVVVIGAGPAGLEAARVAAERGHSVSLYESSKRPGGQLELWSRGNSMVELAKIIHWRISELARLKVDLFFEATLNVEEIRNLGADVIIVATGSNPLVDSNAMDLICPLVMAPHDYIKNPVAGISKAIVVSDGKGQAGLVAAEILSRSGAEVELISSDFAIAADLDPTVRNSWYERLSKMSIRMSSNLSLESFDKDSVRLENVFSKLPETRNNIELIVNWKGCVIEDTFLQSIRASVNDWSKPAEVFAVGDCVSPRTVEIAIDEATLLADTL